MVMMVKAESQEVAVVTDGTYPATLSKVTMFKNAYGERVGFEFTLLGDGVEGQKVTRSTSPVLSSKSKLAEVLVGLFGRDLTPQEITGGIDLETLVGTSCKVLVLRARSRNGAVYSNVERVLPTSV